MNSYFKLLSRVEKRGSLKLKEPITPLIVKKQQIFKVCHVAVLHPRELQLQLECLVIFSVKKVTLIGLVFLLHLKHS